MVAIVDFAAGHLAGVIALCTAEGWPSYAEDPGRAERALTAPGIVTVVAEARGQVAGFATAGSDGEIQAFLILIAVDKTQRGRGIAKRLIEASFAKTGAIRMDLLSTDGAEGFYASFAHHRLPGYRIYPGMKLQE
ncbi:MAG TPA: GNAT family N-acetyltransferase [Caulobacteraceae bacterium]